MSFPFFSACPPPRLFAHRGASGHRPENTMPAFLFALDMGVSYLELDVRMTCDDQVIVLHDSTVDRTTDGTGLAAEMTLSEIRELDAGFRFCPEGEMGYPFRGRGISIPTLREVLEACPAAFLNIEAKQSEPPMEEALKDVLMSCGALERVLLTSKRLYVLRRIREKFGNRVATGISREEGIWFAIGLIFRKIKRPRLKGLALQIPERIGGIAYINRVLVKMAHEAGLEVHVWTVNDRECMREYLDLGVDGIMTDYPERFPKSQICRASCFSRRNEVGD